LLGGYWYFRNWLAFGNPFYPVRMGGLAGQPQQGIFSVTSGFESLRQLFAEKIFDGDLGNPDVSHATGWGWFAFACGWPAAACAFGFDRKYRWLAAGLLVSFISLLCWTFPDPWNMRFVPWMPAVATWGFFLVWRRMGPLVRRVLTLLAIWTTVLNGLGGALPHGMTPDWKTPVAERVWNPALHRHLTEQLPAGEPVAVCGGADDWVYLVYGPSFEHPIRYLEPTGGRGFSETMKAQKLTYLCRIPSGYPARMPRLLDEVRQGRLVDLGQGLYRLPESESRNGNEP
jgi:hypothetical protein